MNACIRYLLTATLGSLLPTLATADCLGPRHTPTSDFLLSPEGWAVHRPTGLMWTRCDMGAIYYPNNHRCSASAQALSWETALNGVQLTNDNQGQAGFHDWRLPTVKELASLIDPCDIDSPALNTDAFPLQESHSGMYWTSTPLLIATVQPAYAYIVNFYGGAVFESRIEQARFVRLVRDASGSP